MLSLIICGSFYLAINIFEIRLKKARSKKGVWAKKIIYSWHRNKHLYKKLGLQTEVNSCIEFLNKSDGLMFKIERLFKMN